MSEEEAEGTTENPEETECTPADVDPTAELMGLLNQLTVAIVHLEGEGMEDMAGLLNTAQAQLLLLDEERSAHRSEVESVTGFHEKVLAAIRGKLSVEEPEDFRVFVEGVLALADLP